MPNLRIAPLNFHDAATVSSAHELAALPFSNTQNIARYRPYRSADASLPYTPLGKGTWGGATRTINCFALLRHNLAGASVRLRLYSDAAWTTQVYDSTSLTANPAITAAYDWGVTGGTDILRSEAAYVHWFTAVTGVKSYQIELSGSLSGAYAEIGRVFLGNALEFTYNPAPGLGLNWESLSEQDRTRGGSLRSQELARWRALSFELSWVANAQQSSLLEIMAKCGLVLDMLVSVHPEAGGRLERDYTMNAKFANLDAITRNNTFGTKKVSLREC